jgi:hypothetical protein
MSVGVVIKRRMRLLRSVLVSVHCGECVCCCREMSERTERERSECDLRLRIVSIDCILFTTTHDTSLIAHRHSGIDGNENAKDKRKVRIGRHELDAVRGRLGASVHLLVILVCSSSLVWSGNLGLILRNSLAGHWRHHMTRLRFIRAAIYQCKSMRQNVHVPYSKLQCSAHDSCANSVRCRHSVMHIPYACWHSRNLFV